MLQYNIIIARFLQPSVFTHSVEKGAFSNRLVTLYYLFILAYVSVSVTISAVSLNYLTRISILNLYKIIDNMYCDMTPESRSGPLLDNGSQRH
jgi:hypothetical protein